MGPVDRAWSQLEPSSSREYKLGNFLSERTTNWTALSTFCLKVAGRKFSGKVTETFGVNTTGKSFTERVFKISRVASSLRRTSNTVDPTY